LSTKDLVDGVPTLKQAANTEASAPLSVKYCSVIETQRLRLRAWIDADIEPWAQMNWDPRVMEFFPHRIAPEYSREQAARVRAELERNGYGWFVLERKAEPGFAGVIVIDDIHWDTPFQPRREIGWRLPVYAWGRGFATEAAGAALEYAFDTLAWPEIVAMTSRLNLRSIRVMEKLGMVRDADCDFEHPRIPEGHPIRPHVLYRKCARTPATKTMA
jgi:RimJ/RimL family protein N-acetyltransferase